MANMIEVHKTNDEIADRIQIEGIVDRNPVRDTAPASEKEAQRDVYIGFQDFHKITECCACWVYYIFWTLYMTGMRRGEALSLTWENVNLDKRIIRLGITQTKERRPKRVPIHKDLIPILLAINSKRKRPAPSDPVFLTPAGSPPNEDSLKKPWREALDSLELTHCLEFMIAGIVGKPTP